MDTDVIVIGAGPVGLMSAGELRLGGADVTVLEKLPRPTAESRASTLHARTMELFDQRGLLESLGRPPRDTMGHFGGIPLDFGDVPSPHAGLWKVPQNRTEELLGAWAGALGATVLRGHELTALSQCENYVEVAVSTPRGPLRLRARYVVGCDGEQGPVRRLAGIGRTGTDAGREMLRADVEGLDIRARRFERLPEGLAVCARFPNGVSRVMVHRFGAPPADRTGDPEFSEIARAWQEVTGEDISHGTPVWVNAFDDRSLQADRYRNERVLLAGDAAHAQMPVGGQALNVGLQEAANLGWKLAAVVTGKTTPSLLDTYHSERHPVGRRVLSNIRAQAAVLLGAGDVGPVRSVLSELLEFAPVRRRLSHMVSGLDVRYEVGPGSHPLLGMRFPPTELVTSSGTVSTSRLLGNGRGLLIGLAAGERGRADGQWTDAAAPWAGRVSVVEGHLTEGAPPGPGAVLVRPDGHVVWTDAEGTGPESALRRWFGHPQPSTERSEHA